MCLRRVGQPEEAERAAGGDDMDRTWRGVSVPGRMEQADDSCNLSQSIRGFEEEK
jgi:hypothetical protein